MFGRFGFSPRSRGLPTLIKLAANVSRSRIRAHLPQFQPTSVFPIGFRRGPRLYEPSIGDTMRASTYGEEGVRGRGLYEYQNSEGHVVDDWS